MKWFLHIAIIISYTITLVRVSDIFISIEKRNFIQDKIESFALFLSYLKPIKIVKYIFNNIFISISLIIFYLCLFYLQPTIAKLLFVNKLDPILTLSAVILMGFAFKNSLSFGKEARKSIIQKISNSNQNLIFVFYQALFKVLLISLIYALFYLLTSSLIGYFEIKYIFNNYENIYFFSLFYGFITATPFLFEFSIYFFLGVLILFSIILIAIVSYLTNILNWFIWKIALYNKGQGALTAIIIFITFLLTITEISIKIFTK